MLKSGLHSSTIVRRGEFALSATARVWASSCARGPSPPAPCFHTKPCLDFNFSPTCCQCLHSALSGVVELRCFALTGFFVFPFFWGGWKNGGHGWCSAGVGAAGMCGHAAALGCQGFLPARRGAARLCRGLFVFFFFCTLLFFLASVRYVRLLLTEKEHKSWEKPSPCLFYMWQQV